MILYIPNIRRYHMVLLLRFDQSVEELYGRLCRNQRWDWVWLPWGKESSLTSHLRETESVSEPCSSKNPGPQVADTAQCFDIDFSFSCWCQGVFFSWRNRWCFGSRGCNTWQSFWLIDPFPVPDSRAAWAGGFSALAPWCLAMANATWNLQFQNSPKRLLHTVECVRFWNIFCKMEFRIGGV